MEHPYMKNQMQEKKRVLQELLEIYLVFFLEGFSGIAFEAKKGIRLRICPYFVR